MSKLCLDVMTVSLTINWCVLCFNVVPKLRIRAIKSQRLKRNRQFMKLCHHFADKPLLFAKVVTEQILVWSLVLLSLVALCATNSIKFPFRPDTGNSWQTLYIEMLFGVNIGRYIFTIIEKIFLRTSERKVQFRAELVHHLVALSCYSLFLAYRQNMLLGLVGITTESTSIFDEAGRYFKERDRRHTVHYKRLVVIGCVWTVCFRGVIPITFLVIAMFQQTPFMMDYAPLTVFFLSIIFFSVINVWQILSNIQRLVKHIYEKSHELYQATRTACDSGGTVLTGGRFGRLQLSKNNLGYLRPYENKNIANQFEDEKHNLNNRKEFAKEALELQVVSPSKLFSAVKQQTSSTDSGLCSAFSADFEATIHTRSQESYQNGQNEMRISNNSSNSTDSIHLYQMGQNDAINRNTSTYLTLSNSSEHLYMNANTESDFTNSWSSAASDLVFLHSNNVARLNNSQSSHVVTLNHDTEPQAHIQSSSTDNISVTDLCHDITSGTGISV